MASRLTFSISFFGLIWISVANNENKFEMIYPKGNTICARGGPYAFAVRQGTVNKVVLEFEGGGGCWDAASCSLPIFTSSVNAIYVDFSLNHARGLRSQKEENALRDYWWVYVPYCTADAHSGNSTHDYGLGLDKVHHMGRANAQAAMDYIRGLVPAPDEVLTTGCSAGSLGAMVWLPYIVGSMYPNARHASWHDSYVGVLGQKMYEGGRDHWPMRLFSEIVPALSNDALNPWTENIGTRIISAVLDAFPALDFSLFTHNADHVQTSYYVLGGGRGSFTSLMRTEMDALKAKYPSGFKYWIARGTSHCIGLGNGYYSMIADDGTDVKLFEWVNSIASFDGKAAPVVDCCGSVGNANSTKAIGGMLLDEERVRLEMAKMEASILGEWIS